MYPKGKGIALCPSVDFDTQGVNTSLAKSVKISLRELMVWLWILMVVKLNTSESLLSSSSLHRVWMGFWLKDLCPLVSGQVVWWPFSCLDMERQMAFQLFCFVHASHVEPHAGHRCRGWGGCCLLRSTEVAFFWVVPNGVDKIGCLLDLGELLHV